MRAETFALALFVVAGIFVASATIAPTPATAADDANKCTIALKGDSPTKLACDRGGRKEAAKQMKAMVKAAKAKGVVFVCDDCHKNNENYEQTDNSKKDFEKLLAAYK